jgi:plastocyanin
LRRSGAGVLDHSSICRRCCGSGGHHQTAEQTRHYAAGLQPARRSATGRDRPENAVNEFGKTIVILEGGKTPPLRPQTITIEQRNGRFDPDLVVLPIGSSVQFPNFDPIFHNVFSLSRAQAFDLGFYPKDKSRTVKFTRAGIVQVYCHIHANMYAAVVVTSSPWFAKPGANGAVSFVEVPPGRYKVIAWHKVAGVHQTELVVPESGPVDVTIRVPIDTERSM